MDSQSKPIMCYMSVTSMPPITLIMERFCKMLSKDLSVLTYRVSSNVGDVFLNFGERTGEQAKIINFKRRSLYLNGSIKVNIHGRITLASLNGAPEFTTFEKKKIREAAEYATFTSFGKKKIQKNNVSYVRKTNASATYANVIDLDLQGVTISQTYLNLYQRLSHFINKN